MAKVPERHFKLREAAVLTGSGDTRTLKSRLAEVGYVLPEIDARKVTVPTSAIELVNQRFAVKPMGR
jgi:hypothetical protein